MILLFGGTTEGRKAIKELEEGGGTYYYSTKTGEQEVTLHHGIRVDGALDREAMLSFCRDNGIRLLIDAAHPFANRLHETVVTVSEALDIPLIRYDRIYPPRDPDITWIDEYSEIPRDIHSLLATTGVQSISKLKPLETEGIRIYYRILNRESSRVLALQQGAEEDQLCYYEDPKAIPVKADAILLKESGISGGFVEKVEAAKACGMRIIAIKRPSLSSLHHESSTLHHTVNGPYGLRRRVEKLLPEFYPLKSGLTTGTCATAAAVADALRCFRGETPYEVSVVLPNGESIPVAVHYADDYAYVVKDSGDDPDVTKGIEIRASVREMKGEKRGESINIVGGEGVGRFTLPGFDFPPGEPAINKGPREMIRQNLSSFLNSTSTLQVTVSVPEGEVIARRTFNPRLGIEDGISIIGVSGIIKPFSEEAFVDSIRKCMQVAKASGSDRVVINSGAKSERFVKALYPDLPAQAFVEYGNYIGETLKIAHELDIRKVTLGVMLGKAVKLAEGQLDTHSKKGTMNKAFITQMLEEAQIANLHLSSLTLARGLWDMLSPEEARVFSSVVIRHCEQYCKPLLPHGELTILLIDENGTIYEKS